MSQCQGKHEPDHTCTRKENHIGDHWCHCGKRWPVERPMATLQLIGEVISCNVDTFAPSAGREAERRTVIEFGAIQEMSLIADPWMRESMRETEKVNVKVTIEYFRK